jgi:hypothetical protein
MANYDLQVLIHAASALPEDDVVNTLHYEITGPDTIEGTCDDIGAAYAVWANAATIGGGDGSMTIKVYDGGVPNPAGPVFSKDYAHANTGGSGPTEVALCLSYATVDDPMASTPRRRGRIYLGPFLTNEFSARPGAALISAALELGQGLASAGNASNSTWLMYSRRDMEYAKIESIWVDDAWDTQRRRGLAPTARTVQDVQ